MTLFSKVFSLVFSPFISACVVSGNPYYDSLGSLGVGTLLGTVSAFLIYTNTEALLGRSIQAERVQKLTEFLENDPAVRSANEQRHALVCTHTPANMNQVSMSDLGSVS